MRVSWLFACCLARVQTAASRPTNAEKEGERKAEKSMHLLRKQKKKEKKYVLQIQKNMHKKSLAVRAGSVRPRGLAVIIKVCT